MVVVSTHGEIVRTSGAMWVQQVGGCSLCAHIEVLVEAHVSSSQQSEVHVEPDASSSQHIGVHVEVMQALHMTHLSVGGVGQHGSKSESKLGRIAAI
jgi:hypothetical protein